MIYAVVNVNAEDMADLIISTHSSLENARWAESAMAWNSIETEVVEYTDHAMAKIKAQIDLIDELRENLRTGIRRNARAVAASSRSAELGLGGRS